MDFRPETPIYVQIAQDIRSRILRGELAPGDQLMSTTQYATVHRINPATANKAFAQLVTEGLVVKRRGIGMFVAAEAPEILRAAGRTAYREEVLAPALAHGLDLGLSPADIRALAHDILEDT